MTRQVILNPFFDKVAGVLPGYGMFCILASLRRIHCCGRRNAEGLQKTATLVPGDAPLSNDPLKSIHGPAVTGVSVGMMAVPFEIKEISAGSFSRKQNPP